MRILRLGPGASQTTKRLPKVAQPHFTPCIATPPPQLAHSPAARCFRTSPMSPLASSSPSSCFFAADAAAVSAANSSSAVLASCRRETEGYASREGRARPREPSPAAPRAGAGEGGLSARRERRLRLPGLLPGGRLELAGVQAPLGRGRRRGRGVEVPGAEVRVDAAPPRARHLVALGGHPRSPLRPRLRGGSGWIGGSGVGGVGGPGGSGATLGPAMRALQFLCRDRRFRDGFPGLRPPAEESRERDLHDGLACRPAGLLRGALLLLALRRNCDGDVVSVDCGGLCAAGRRGQPRRAARCGAWRRGPAFGRHRAKRGGGRW